MEEETAALRHVLEHAPCSTRKLAFEAGLHPSMLQHIKAGRRRLTPETKRAVVTALRRWSERCTELADVLEAAPPETGGGDG